MIQQVAGTGAADVAGIPDVRGLSHAYVYQAIVDGVATPVNYERAQCSTSLVTPAIDEGPTIWPVAETALGIDVPTVT